MGDSVIHNADFGFRTLTFIKSEDEIKRNIKNTLIMFHVYKRFMDIKPLGNLLVKSQYGFTASAADTGNCKLLRITDIKEDGVNWDTVPFCFCDDIDKYRLYKNDIVIARTGGTTGKSYIIDSDVNDAVFASYLIRLTVSRGNNIHYIYSFLNSYLFWSQILEMKNGTAQPNVNAEKMKQLSIPVCPQDSQNEIAKYYLSDTISGKLTQMIDEDYKRISVKFNDLNFFKYEQSMQIEMLSKLRQAILQEAIEGKLTAEWRASTALSLRKSGKDIKGDPDYDAVALLEKVMEEKAAYQGPGTSRTSSVSPASRYTTSGSTRCPAKCTEMPQHPGTGQKVRGKKEKALPEIADSEKPFELPEGWVWTRLSGMLANTKNALKAGPFGSSLTKSEYKKTGYKIYGQEQVISQDPFYGNYFIDEQKYEQLKSCAITPGDILISLVGTIGKILILPDNVLPGIINPRLIKISLHTLIYKRYFTLLYSSRNTQEQLKVNATGQTMDVINIKNLSKVVFPLPPLTEQQTIVERVDNLLAMVDVLEKQVNERKVLAEELMQSVLREAFG